MDMRCKRYGFGALEYLMKSPRATTRRTTLVITWPVLGADNNNKKYLVLSCIC